MGWCPRRRCSGERGVHQTHDGSGSAIWIAMTRSKPRASRRSTAMEPRAALTRPGSSAGKLVKRSSVDVPQLRQVRRRRHDGAEHAAWPAVTAPTYIHEDGGLRFASSSNVSWRGWDLTRVDATSCKIRATSALGVAPNRSDSAMTATTTTDPAKRPPPRLALRGCASAKTPPGPVWRYRLNLSIGCQSDISGVLQRRAG